MRDSSRLLERHYGEVEGFRASCVGSGSVTVYLCGFSFGAAECRAACCQRLRVRLIALSCSHLRLNAMYILRSRVKYENGGMDICRQGVYVYRLSETVSKRTPGIDGGIFPVTAAIGRWCGSRERSRCAQRRRDA
jgi:hypothetical protein